jgi:Zn-dependent membrane protease YugP
MALSAAIMAGMFIFSLVTLPVERNASDRALKSLEAAGIAVGEEVNGVRKVLRAAAFTYLAGLAQHFGRLLFYAVMVAMAKGFFQPT